MALDDGWPARFVVRDLEGASLNRDHPGAGRRFGAVIAADSPALYEEAEVWRRFAYYVLVNHLGQLVATLAEHLGPSEAELWSVAGDVLADEAGARTAPIPPPRRCAVSSTAPSFRPRPTSSACCGATASSRPGSPSPTRCGPGPAR